MTQTTDERRFTRPSPTPATQQCLPQGADRIDPELSSTRSGDGRGSVNVNVAVVDSGIANDAPDLNLLRADAMNVVHLAIC